VKSGMARKRSEEQRRRGDEVRSTTEESQIGVSSSKVPVDSTELGKARMVGHVRGVPSTAASQTSPGKARGKIG
jgi:hypothetical protein